MTPIKLDAGQVLVVGERIVVVAEGTHQRPPTLSMEQAGEAECDKCAKQPGPPAWMTAATEPCEECAGKGWLHVGAHSCMGCPKCKGIGRPILTIGVECERCDGKGKLGRFPIFNKLEELTTCPECNNGTVTYRLTVSEEHPKALPIVDGRTQEMFTVISDRGSALILMPNGHWLLIRDGQIATNGQGGFPPAAAPGQYALIGEVVR